MKQKISLILSSLALIISIVAIIFSVQNLTQSFSLSQEQGRIIANNIELSKKILQLAIINELQKPSWVENVSPGLNRFESSAFGIFDYPAAWGEPLARKTSFANGLWYGDKWTLEFKPASMTVLPVIEAYHHDPSANIYYPFEIEIPHVNIALAADAVFAGGYSDYAQILSAAKACEAYKKLHILSSACQKFSEDAFFIDSNMERVWFVASPKRNDSTQQANYPGVTIHYNNTGSDFIEQDNAVKKLVESLKPAGISGNVK